MFPTALAGIPPEFRRWVTRAVVVVLPLVPVTATHATDDRSKANSISEMTCGQATMAERSSAELGGMPGLAMQRSYSPSAWLTPNSTCAPSLVSASAIARSSGWPEPSRTVTDPYSVPKRARQYRAQATPVLPRPRIRMSGSFSTWCYPLNFTDWKKNTAKPKPAMTPVMIQKRTMIFVSDRRSSRSGGESVPCGRSVCL